MTEETADDILREYLRNPDLARQNPQEAQRLGLDWDGVQHIAESRQQVSAPLEQAKQASKASRQHPEQDFQGAVIDLLHIHGWHVAAVRHARTLKGWRTPWEADGKGMKDLIAVKDRVIWAELKVPGGVVSPEQRAWHEWLIAAGQEAYIWYPTDWDEIVKVLT